MEAWQLESDQMYILSHNILCFEVNSVNCFGQMRTRCNTFGLLIITEDAQP